MFVVECCCQLSFPDVKSPALPRLANLVLGVRVVLPQLAVLLKSGTL